MTVQDRFAEVKVRFWGCSQPINMYLGNMQRCDVAVTLQLSSSADHIESGSDPDVIVGYILWNGFAYSHYDEIYTYI